MPFYFGFAYGVMISIFTVVILCGILHYIPDFEWETILGSLIALVAAIGAVKFAESSERNRREKVSNASRARLSIAASDMYRYFEQFSDHCLLVRDGGNPNFTAITEVSPESLNALEMYARNATNEEAEICISIINRYQIFLSRSKSSITLSREELVRMAYFEVGSLPWMWRECLDQIKMLSFLFKFARKLDDVSRKNLADQDDMRRALEKNSHPIGKFDDFDKIIQRGNRPRT